MKFIELIQKHNKNLTKKDINIQYMNILLGNEKTPVEYTKYNDTFYALQEDITKPAIGHFFENAKESFRQLDLDNTIITYVFFHRISDTEYMCHLLKKDDVQPKPFLISDY